MALNSPRIHQPTQVIGASESVYPFLEPVLDGSGINLVHLGKKPTNDELIRTVETEGVQVAVSRTEIIWDGKLLRNMPGLGAVLGACRNPHIDKEAAQEYIWGLNSPVNGSYVARRARDTINAIMNGTLKSMSDIKGGEWTKDSTGAEILYPRDYKVGVLGFGNIGQQVVEQLIREGAGEVRVFNDGSGDRKYDEQIGARYKELEALAKNNRVALERVSNLDELVSNSHILTLHASSEDWEGNPNKGLITADHLRKLGGKKPGILVNLARRDLVEPSDEALQEMITNGELGFYFTDVFDKSLENRSAFRQPFSLAATAGTPHLGGSGREISEVTAQYVYDTLFRHWERGEFPLGSSSLFPRNFLGFADRAEGDLALTLITSTLKGIESRLAGIIGSFSGLGIRAHEAISDYRAGSNKRHGFVPRTLSISKNGTDYASLVSDIRDALIRELGPELKSIRFIPTTQEQRKVLLEM